MDAIEYYKIFDNKSVSFIYRPNGEIYPEDEKKQNNNTLLEKLHEKVNNERLQKPMNKFN